MEEVEDIPVAAMAEAEGNTAQSQLNCKATSKGISINNINTRTMKMILTEKNTLFDSLMGKIRAFDKLRRQLEYMLFRGESIEYLPDNREQEQLMMHGFIINDHNVVAVANKIFEMRLYRYFVGESKYSQDMRRQAMENKPDFIKDGKLDIPLIMSRPNSTRNRPRIFWIRGSQA